MELMHQLLLSILHLSTNDRQLFERLAGSHMDMLTEWQPNHQCGFQSHNSQVRTEIHEV